MEDTLGTPARHPLVITLGVLVFAECALLAVATIYLVIEILTVTPDSYASAAALAVLTAIATVWLAVIGLNVFRGRAWVRGAALVWQVLQIAVAIGAFQGAFARTDIGWALLVPSVVVIVLLFTPPVLAAVRRRE